MNFAATSELAATSAVAVTYSFLPDPWDIVLEFQRVQTTAFGGGDRKIHNGPVGWTAGVIAPRYRFSPFSVRILDRVKPLIGAGLGFYLLEHSLTQRGQLALRADCDRRQSAFCVTPEEKLTSGPGVHAEAGVEFILFWGWSLSVEYRWMSLTPNITVDTLFANPGADPPVTTNRTTDVIQPVPLTFAIFNWMLRYQF